MRSPKLTRGAPRGFSGQFRPVPPPGKTGKKKNYFFFLKKNYFFPTCKHRGQSGEYIFLKTLEALCLKAAGSHCGEREGGRGRKKIFFLYASTVTSNTPSQSHYTCGSVMVQLDLASSSEGEVRVRFLDEEMGSENIFFFPVSAPATTIGKKLFFLSLKLHTRPLSPVTPPAPTIGKRDEEKKYFFFFKLQHTH